MIKRYKTISGIRGILEGTRIEEVEFEYQDSMLDLAKVNAVYPDTFTSTISNLEEYWDRRNKKWHEENPNPKLGFHEPSMMGTLTPSFLPCVTIQIGTQTFHFNEDVETMFTLVCNERNDYETIRQE